MVLFVILLCACSVFFQSLSQFTKAKNSKTDILQPGKKLLWDTDKASACFPTKTL